MRFCARLWLAASVLGLAACPHGSSGGRFVVGTRVQAPPLPEPPRAPSLPLKTPESISDGIQLYLAGAPPKGQNLGTLRTQLCRAVLRNPGRWDIEEQLRHLLTLTQEPDRPCPEKRWQEDPCLPKALGRLARRVFERDAARGKVASALLAQAILADLEPAGRREHAETFRQILTWTDRTAREGERDEKLLLKRTLDLFAGLLASWPSALVRDELLRRLRSLASRRVRPEPLYVSLPYLFGDPRAWRRAAASLPRNALVARLLEAAVSPRATPLDWLALADFYLRDVPAAAERVCRLSTRRFPASAAAWYCLGKRALEKGQALRAIYALHRAVKLRPQWKQPWEDLSEAYLRRLAVLVNRQESSSADAFVRAALAYQRRADATWLASPLERSLADVFYAAGQERAVLGDILGAAKFYRAALEYKRSPQTLAELGHIAFWQGAHAKAARLYDQALKAVPDDGRRVYWTAKVAKNYARALRRLGKHSQAATFLRRAAANTLRLAVLVKERNLRADLLVEDAILQDLLGDRSRALQLFEVALSHASNREGIYPKIMSFLVERGLVDQALDTYVRVDDIPPYHRIYAAMWILGLGRVCRVAPIRLSLAERFLSGIRGPRWEQRLAAWYRGDVTDEQILRAADTLGKRVELSFMQALKALAKGNVQRARGLWQRIRKTHLYVYFEYQMADWWLRHGLRCEDRVVVAPERKRER